MFSEQSLVTRLIWISLLFSIAESLVLGRWSLAFIAAATLGLSMTPLYVARWMHVRVPPSFMAAVVLFVWGTIFLGEVFDFYNRYWWWDIVMHGGSAIGFGLIGTVLVLIMFQGDRYAAPPIAIAFFAYCFAVSIGASWEVFEFSMDQLFGTNMQKSGLRDTMGDLIVDHVGAILGASAGFAYLKGQERGGLTRMIDDFVKRNPRFFKKLKDWQHKHDDTQG
ncbi:hypothetical protein PSM7751_04023 [Pseudooceanicola marinus]|uniref:Inner membrane protein YjdF n=1 Tax=Pseudooceanicola marinus TaxID=396013 RepID=A0A1X7A9A4_9RHOB|nr:hypothetical protein [Pseudooceanicola marinus]PJE33545.1 hypothetical protein CVM50_00670 [Pseudooceanicola marinus]SLN73265.1 hypothetical protein PSM7751_04023 [Pseudooceanicola marinus]